MGKSWENHGKHVGTYELPSKPSLHLSIVTIIGDRFLGECPIALPVFRAHL